MYKFMQYSKNEAGQTATPELKATHTQGRNRLLTSPRIVSRNSRRLRSTSTIMQLCTCNTKSVSFWVSERKTSRITAYTIKSSPVQTCAKGVTESASERLCFQQQRSENQISSQQQRGRTPSPTRIFVHPCSFGTSGLKREGGPAVLQFSSVTHNHTVYVCRLS